MRHYAINYRRVTFREYVRLAYPNTILAALMWFPLRIGLIRRQPEIMSFPESIRDANVCIEDLPEPCRSHMFTVLPNITDQGFLDPMIEVATSTGIESGHVIGTCMRSRHASGRYILQTLFSFSRNGFSQSQNQLVTFFEHNRTTATVDGRPTFNRIPSADATYHPNADLGTLLSLHDRKLERLNVSPIQIANRDQMVHHVDALADRFFTHMVERGIFTEVTSSCH